MGDVDGFKYSARHVVLPRCKLINCRTDQYHGRVRSHNISILRQKYDRILQVMLYLVSMLTKKYRNEVETI